MSQTYLSESQIADLAARFWFALRVVIQNVRPTVTPGDFHFLSVPQKAFWRSLAIQASSPEDENGGAAECNVIDRLAARMYRGAADHGFHEGEAIGPDAITTERMGLFCANLHGEVSELWEACRKGVLHNECDKGISLTNAEEELADIVIRAMDTAHALGISLGGAVAKKSKYNEGRPYKHGKRC